MASQDEYPKLLRVRLRGWKDQTSVHCSVGMGTRSLVPAFFFACRTQIFLLSYFLFLSCLSLLLYF